jgi:hypothetical protein
MITIDDLSFIKNENDRLKMSIAINICQEFELFKSFKSDEVSICKKSKSMCIDDQKSVMTGITTRGVKINEEFMEKYYHLNADLFELPIKERNTDGDYLKYNFIWWFQEYEDMFNSDSSLQAHIKHIGKECNTGSCMEIGWICDNLRYLAINGFEKYKKFKYHDFETYDNNYKTIDLS